MTDVRARDQVFDFALGRWSTDDVKRWVIAVIVPACLAAALVPSTAANAFPKSPIKMNPIHAEFQQSAYRTVYISRIDIDSPIAAAGLTVTWKLKLELVDKAGAPDPEMTAMGLKSGAAVDPGCSNHGDLEQTEHYTADQLKRFGYKVTPDFLWYHPDAADSYPAGWFHCNHMLQGPHGHQGLITVVVSYGSWDCSATFKGTHSSVPAPSGTPNPNVENETASEPMCLNI